MVLYIEEQMATIEEEKRRRRKEEERKKEEETSREKRGGGGKTVVLGTFLGSGHIYQYLIVPMFSFLASVLKPIIPS